jgi:hypothetical protein
VFWSIPTCLTFMFIYLRSISLFYEHSLQVLPSLPEKFMFLFLTCHACHTSSHLFINTIKCVVTFPLHWVFPELFDAIWWLYFQREETSSSFWPLEYKTPTYSRNFSNQLPSIVISYNRRKCRLFIPLWKPKPWCNCMNCIFNKTRNTMEEDARCRVTQN